MNNFEKIAHSKHNTNTEPYVQFRGGGVYTDKFLFRVNAKMNNDSNDTKVIMISGQMSVTQDQFDRYYKSLIDSVLEKRKNGKPLVFLVGGAKGVDMLAQEYLSDKVSSGIVDVIVCDIIGEYNVFNKEAYGHVATSSKFTQRDEYMTYSSSDDIAFLTADEKSIGSGAFTNILRRHFGHVRAKQFRDWVRKDPSRADIGNCTEMPPGFEKQEMEKIVLLYKTSVMDDPHPQFHLYPPYGSQSFHDYKMIFYIFSQLRKREFDVRDGRTVACTWNQLHFETYEHIQNVIEKIDSFATRYERSIQPALATIWIARNASSSFPHIVYSVTKTPFCK